MNFYKKRSGFTLIEASLAILIIGFSITTLISLQMSLSKGVYSAHNFIERIAAIKNLFAKADFEKYYKSGNKEINLEDPKTKLVYSTEKVEKHNALKAFKNILIEKVDAEWQGAFGKKKETLITFRFDIKEK